MVNLEFLSDNLLIMINKLVSNQVLVQYLIDNDKDVVINDPSKNIDGNTLLWHKIYPAPFDEKVTTKECSNLRVYYDSGDINGAVIEDIIINFDVVVAKGLWLMNVVDVSASDQSSKGKVRPIEIMKEVVNTFPQNKSFDTLGQLEFKGFRHLYVNEMFDAIQIKARMITYAKQ